MYLILITMFFSDPIYTGKDSILIERYNGKPLVFNTLESCYDWVEKDFINIKNFGEFAFPEAVSLKAIDCVTQE